MTDADRMPLEFNELPPGAMLRRAQSFTELLRTRRTVREFSDRPVPRELIEQAIRAAASAPSGANQQPWRFAAISDPAIKSRIREAAEQVEREFYEGRKGNEEWLEDLEPLGTSWRKPYLETAPWLVAVFEQRYRVDAEDKRHKHYYTRESVGLACGIFIAALHNMGLCTLTHTPAPMNFLAEILERPAGERAFILFPVGYPAEDCTVPRIERKPFDEVAVWHDDQALEDGR